jgi:predicted GTPase
LYEISGRDEKAVKTVEFYPPDGMTSAEVGYAIDGFVDNKDVISLIIYWADKGYLKIKTIKKDEFELLKQKDPDDKMKLYEKQMFNKMFGDSRSVTAQDLHVAGFAKDQHKGVILVVNKWDAVEKDEKDMAKFLAYLHSKINFLSFAPVIFVSAVTRKNVDKIPELIEEVGKSREKRVPTSELNLLLGEDILKKAPPAKRGVLPKINYVTQADTNPPTFVFFTNHPDIIHFSYSRYLENKIREHWDFTGTPINIVFKRKNVDNKKK